MSCGQLAASLQRRQPFREFLVSPALISKLNVHKRIGLSHVKCKKNVTSFICSLSFYLITYPERCSWKYNDKFILLSFLERYSSTLLNQCILLIVNFDLSMSLFLYNINVWSYKYVIQISDRYLHYLCK